MAVTKRHVNKALVVNIPLQSHFIKGLVFILHTHPFLCSGKHTHPEESFLPLAQSTQLSQWIWLDAFKVPDIPAVLSFNQPFPFTWRAGCTHFFFLDISNLWWTFLCLCLDSFVLTSILYTVPTGQAPDGTHRLRTLSRPAGAASFGRPASLSQGALGATCSLPMPCCARPLLFSLSLRTGSFYSRNAKLLSDVLSVFSPSPPVRVFAFCHH